MTPTLSEGRRRAGRRFEAPHLTHADRAPSWRPAPFGRPMVPNRPELGVAPVVAAAGSVLARLIWPAAIVGGGLLLTPKLAPSLKLDPDTLRLSLLLGGAGGAALALGPMLPESIRPLGTAAGIAGLVGSVFVLLGSSAEAAEGEPTLPPPSFEPGVAPPGREVPALPAGQLRELVAVQLDPQQRRTGETVRSLFGSQEYEYVARNTGARALTFFVGLRIFSSGQQELFRSFPDLSVYGRRQIAVPAAAGGRPGEAVGRLVSPSVVSLPQAVTVEVEAFRAAADQEPFGRSEAIPVRMAFLGFEAGG